MKTILFAAAMLLSFACYAQVGPGLFAGGQMGFTSASSKTVNGSNTTKGPVTTTFSIMPRAGYFFTDNIAAGLVFGYATTNSKSTVFDTKTVSNTISAGLFGRYALALGEEGNFAFLGDLNFGFASTTGKTTSTVGSLTIINTADPETQISVGISPGILFFPTPKIGLEANLGNIIQVSTITVTDANNSDNKTTYTDLAVFNLSTLGFNFGFNYYFSR